MLLDLVQEKKKKKKINLVRMRLELMTLALLAPCSADWANGPTTTLCWTNLNIYLISYNASILKWVGLSGNSLVLHASE